MAPPRVLFHQVFLSLMHLCRQVDLPDTMRVTNYHSIGERSLGSQSHRQKCDSTVSCAMMCIHVHYCQFFSYNVSQRECHMLRPLQPTPDTKKHKLMTYNTRIYRNLDFVSDAMSTSEAVTKSSTTEGEVYCPQPKVKNGYVRGDDTNLYIEGETVIYECNIRYSLCDLDVENKLECLAGGQWTPVPYTCHKHMWAPKTLPTTVTFTCAGRPGSLIAVKAKFSNTTPDSMVVGVLKGQAGIFSHHFYAKSVDSYKGHYVLKWKRQESDTKWKILQRVSSAYVIDEYKNIHIKFRIVEHGFTTQMFSKVVYKYHSSEMNISIETVTVSGDMHDTYVNIHYPRRTFWRNF